MGISREQALDCFHSDDLVGLGMEADAVRRQLHPERVVTYTIQARIQCAALPNDDPSATLDALYANIGSAADQGAESIRLLHCLHTVPIEDVLRGIKARFPSLWVEALSPDDIHSLSKTLGLGVQQTLTRLIDAGLDAIATDGVILAEPTSCPIREALANWHEVHRAAHSLGMQTVAGMIFGTGETAEQRVDFLETVRQLQQETGGFAAFAPAPAGAPNGRELDGVTAVESLKTLAIARMFLDNIPTLQAYATPRILKVLQTTLRFGANDTGPISPEAGAEEDIRRIIRDAGFRPAQRELGYRAMSLA